MGLRREPQAGVAHGRRHGGLWCRRDPAGARLRRPHDLVHTLSRPVRMGTWHHRRRHSLAELLCLVVVGRRGHGHQRGRRVAPPFREAPETPGHARRAAEREKRASSGRVERHRRRRPRYLLRRGEDAVQHDDGDEGAGQLRHGLHPGVVFAVLDDEGT